MNKMRKRLVGLFGCASVIACLTGCDSAQPTNVMENADAKAFQDYERMIAEDANVQDLEAPDKQKAK